MIPNCEYPTCGNCDKALSCDNKRYDCACVHHPNAREYLMQDVVKELEQLISEYANGEDDYRDGIKLGIEKAIAIIKGGAS